MAGRPAAGCRRWSEGLPQQAMPISDDVPVPRCHITTDRYVEPTLRLREDRAELMRQRVLALQDEALGGVVDGVGKPAEAGDVGAP
jgi:hypothetical protein